MTTPSVEEATHLLVDAIRAEMRDAAAPQGPPRLMEVPEAAAALHISRATLYERIGDGSIRSVKVGGRRLVPESEIARVASPT